MIQGQCYNCIHEKICNYKGAYNDAINEIANVSYKEQNGKLELIEKSQIIFVAKCPHFVGKNEIRGNGNNDR